MQQALDCCRCSPVCCCHSGFQCCGHSACCVQATLWYCGGQHDKRIIRIACDLSREQRRVTDSAWSDKDISMQLQQLVHGHPGFTRHARQRTSCRTVPCRLHASAKTSRCHRLKAASDTPSEFDVDNKSVTKIDAELGPREDDVGSHIAVFPSCCERGVTNVGP